MWRYLGDVAARVITERDTATEAFERKPYGTAAGRPSEQGHGSRVDAVQHSDSVAVLRPLVGVSSLDFGPPLSGTVLFFGSARVNAACDKKFSEISHIGSDGDVGLTVVARGAKQAKRRHDPGGRAALTHFAARVITDRDSAPEQDRVRPRAPAARSSRASAHPCGRRSRAGAPPRGGPRPPRRAADTGDRRDPARRRAPGSTRRG